MSVSVHGGLIGDFVLGLESPKIFLQASPDISRQLDFLVRCRTGWVAVVCRDNPAEYIRTQLDCPCLY